MREYKYIVRILVSIIFILSVIFIAVEALDYFDPPESERFLEERANRDWTSEFTEAGIIAVASAAVFVLTFDKKLSVKK